MPWRYSNLATARRLDALTGILLLALLVRPAAAQSPRPNTDAGSGSPACLPSASRVTTNCEPQKVVVRAENEIKLSLELPPPKIEQCAATIEIEYTQRNTLASVAGKIENEDCAASNGEYRVTVSIRDENLELHTLEFVESWERRDDQPVSFKADYALGEDVDLVRVRARQLRCTCADMPEE